MRCDVTTDLCTPDASNHIMEDLIQRLDANNGHDPEQVFEIIDQINSYYLNLVDYTKIGEISSYWFSHGRSQPKLIAFS